MVGKYDVNRVIELLFDEVELISEEEGKDTYRCGGEVGC